MLKIIKKKCSNGEKALLINKKINNLVKIIFNFCYFPLIDQIFNYSDNLNQESTIFIFEKIMNYEIFLLLDEILISLETDLNICFSELLENIYENFIDLSFRQKNVKL